MTGETKIQIARAVIAAGLIFATHTAAPAQTPPLGVTPKVVNFGGKVLTEAPTRASTVTLTSNAPKIYGTVLTQLMVTDVRLTGPDASSFSISGQPSYQPLPAYSAGNTEVGLVFHPQRVGAVSAQLQIVTANPVTTTSVPLAGIGLEARGSLYSGKFNGISPGRSTIGTGGDYPSLHAACTDISSSYPTGGDWEFLILNDLVETSSSAIGVYHTNGHTITFRPAPGTRPSITFPLAGRVYIGSPVSDQPNPARTSTRNVVFDGAATSGGTDRSLTFRNTGAAGAASLFSVLGDADFVTLRNLNIICAPTTANDHAYSAIELLAEFPPATPQFLNPVPGAFADHATIENCHIAITSIGPNQGVMYSEALLGQFSSYRARIPGARGLAVKNNHIQSNAGGVLAWPVITAEISGNLIQVAPTYSNPYQFMVPAGIFLSGHSIHDEPADYLIAANTIKLLDAETTHPFAAISFHGNGTSSTVKVHNNMISGLTAANAGEDRISRLAIANDSAKPTTALVNHNSIELSGQTLSTTVTQTAAIGSLFEGYAGTMIFKNNIIRLAVNGAAAYNIKSNSGALVSDNNNIFITNGAVTAYDKGTEYPTLIDWQSQTGRDVNSISIDSFQPATPGSGTWQGPIGSADVDLHFSAFPGEAYLVPRVAGVSLDADRESRGALLTVVGADEVAQPSATVDEWIEH